MSKNILIIGATGLIGAPITCAIVAAKSSFGRIVVLTSEATASKKAQVISQLKDGGVEIELIKWAAESGSVKRFFPSEYGTDIEHDSSSGHEKPHQLKLNVRALAKTVQNLEFTYLVTGPYPDLYMDKSPIEEIGTFDVRGKRAVLLGDGKIPVNFTAMSDVGKLVVAAIKHYDASRDKVLIVNSFTATPRQILAEFEKQTQAKWDVSYTSLEQLKRGEEQAWADGAPYATGYTLRRIWTEGGTLYDTPRDNALIGEPQMETLADRVRQVIEKQLHA